MFKCSTLARLAIVIALASNASSAIRQIVPAARVCAVPAVQVAEGATFTPLFAVVKAQPVTALAVVDAEKVKVIVPPVEGQVPPELTATVI